VARRPPDGTRRPYASGEVILQSYNTILSLGHSSANCDGLILVENEVLHRTCKELLGIGSPSFKDLNGVAARGLAAALAPAAPRGGRRVRLLGDLVEHLCCHPAHPLLSSYTLPQIPEASVAFTTFSWAAILKRLRQMLVTGSKLEEGIDWRVSLEGGGSAAGINKSISNYLLLRGPGHDRADVSAFADPRLYCAWSRRPLMVAGSPEKISGCEMTAGLLSNSQACTAPLRAMLSKAYHMFSVRAFTHQYLQHGVSLQDFEAAFSRAEDLICSYGKL